MTKKKEHSWVRENTISYIDKDLTESERIDYINHLNNCESCSASYKKIENILKDGYIKEHAPNYLWERVNESIANSQPNAITNNLFGFKYKLSYVIVFVFIVLSTFVGNAYIFSNNETMSHDISEMVFPVSSDDFSSVVESSLLSVLDNEK
jgi:predicted anti-sigma-YlaC factor YlaD